MKHLLNFSTTRVRNFFAQIRTFVCHFLSHLHLRAAGRPKNELKDCNACSLQVVPEASESAVSSDTIRTMSNSALAARGAFRRWVRGGPRGPRSRGAAGPGGTHRRGSPRGARRSPAPPRGSRSPCRARNAGKSTWTRQWRRVEKPKATGQMETQGDPKRKERQNKAPTKMKKNTNK